jgi:hypothetical protein
MWKRKLWRLVCIVFGIPVGLVAMGIFLFLGACDWLYCKVRGKEFHMFEGGICRD